MSNGRDIYDEFVWATSEESKEQALKLQRLKSLIEEHGCTLEYADLQTGEIHVSCKDENGKECPKKSQALAFALGNVDF